MVFLKPWDVWKSLEKKKKGKKAVSLGETTLSNGIKLITKSYLNTGKHMPSYKAWTSRVWEGSISGYFYSLRSRCPFPSLYHVRCEWSCSQEFHAALRMDSLSLHNCVRRISRKCAPEVLVSPASRDHLFVLGLSKWPGATYQNTGMSVTSL